MHVAPGAWRLAAVPFALAPVGAVVLPPAGVVLFVLGVGVLWFHRDPPREVPAGGFIVPADGRVTSIHHRNGRLRVGVFMNLDDVHVIRTPTSGTITEQVHHPGAHRPAFTKTSAHNERLEVQLTTGDEPVSVIMIAGAFARRIHPYQDTGDAVDRGQRLGHISFGSRVDVILPPSVPEEDLAVEIGDQVKAGETILAPSKTD